MLAVRERIDIEDIARAGRQMACEDLPRAVRLLRVEQVSNAFLHCDIFGGEPSSFLEGDQSKACRIGVALACGYLGPAAVWPLEFSQSRRRLPDARIVCF